MEEDLLEFLQSKCKLNPTQLAEVQAKLEEAGLSVLAELFELTQAELESLGIKKFQAIMISKAINSTKNVGAEDKPKEGDSGSQFFQDEKQKVQHEKDEEQKSGNPAQLNEPYHPHLEEPEQINTFKKPERKDEVGPRDDMSMSSYKDEMDRDFFVLFQSFEDSSSEYRMNKIRLEEKEYLRFFQKVRESQLSVHGFYGCYESCLKMARIFVGKDIEVPIDIVEGMLALRNEQKVPIIYKTKEDIFNFNNGTDSQQLATTYLRYLVDVCQNIYAVLPDSVSLNPDLKNPYEDFINPSFSLKEKIVQPDDKVSITDIPMSPDKKLPADLFYHQSSLDYQKYIYNAYFEVKSFSQDIKYRIMKQSLYEKGSYSDKQELDFNQLKQVILNNWTETNHFFFDNYYRTDKFSKSVNEVVFQFIKPYDQEKRQYQETLKQTQEEYKKNYEELKNDLEKSYHESVMIVVRNFAEQLKEYSCEKYELAYQERDLKDEGSVGFFDKIKNLWAGDPSDAFKCNHNCSYFSNEIFTFRSSLSQQDKEKVFFWDLLEKSWTWGKIHKVEVKKFKEDMKKLVETCKKIFEDHKSERPKRFTDLRTKTLIEFFEKIDDLVMYSKENINNKVQITFNSINIIRDVKHEVSNWNLQRSTFSINHTFSKETTGTPKIKQLLFLSEFSGLVIFSNSPDNKSSIYHFNVQNKMNPLFQFVQTLSSPDANLIVEPNLRQWMIFDNSIKRCHMGKLTSQGKIEEGIPLNLYDMQKDGFRIDEIKSACFLPLGDRILLLNQQNVLLQYQWQSRQLQVITKSVNRDIEGVSKSFIKPTDSDDSYEEIQSFFDGKNYILISRKSIDVYDLNNDKIQSFPRPSEYLFMKSYNDKMNNYILIFEKSLVKVYKLQGLTATKQIESEIKNHNKHKSKGNPIFDYLFQAFKKFGPHSDFIGCPCQTQLFFLFTNPEISVQNVRKYFQGLGFQNVSLAPKLFKSDQLDKLNIFDENDSIMDNQSLKMILLGRIAIHCATIENFTLVPLQNGINISDQIAENLIKNKDKSSDLIERIIEMIKFGIYDTVLEGIKTPISVVSIVGRQSSGKSYVMNRFFGTRFNVAATRCTDGIWMSIVEIYHNRASKIFIILDCEGLFSARRNDQEEMKLCLALSAVSDIMILNQDLAFNRHLNTLFNNFTKCIGRIKGKKLFKGCLMMLVRDVKSDEAEGAYKELQSNLLQLQQSKQDKFLGAVFQGDLRSQCLNYFQQPIFNQEIEHVREEQFLALNNDRWPNGKDFLESFKITLAQVFADDDTDMDIHKIKIQCENLYSIALQMFFEGGDKFQGEESIIDMKFKIEDTEHQFQFNQGDMKLDQNIDEFDDSSDNSSMSKFILIFMEQVCNYELSKHNEWYSGFTSSLNVFLDKRMDYVLRYFKTCLPSDEEFEDVIKSYEYKLKSIFDTYITKSKYCDRLCRSCKRRCVLKLNHKSDCNCETLHICQDQCKMSPLCEQGGYKCVEKFGHEGEHRCNDGNHKCTSNCGVDYCAFTCYKEFGHPESEGHECGNKHPCKQKCEDELCTRTCQFDSQNEHENHICGEAKCIHKCYLCDKKCVSTNHLHAKAIAEDDEVGMKFDKDGKEIRLNYHICDSDHLCKEICDQKGVCHVNYKIEEKVWKNEFGEFPYKYFLPEETRKECKIMIPAFLLKHGGGHDCKIANHRCTFSCPECKSFCNMDIDHDGRHSTNTHRNKENSVFASSKDKKVAFMVEGTRREYKVGESCQPENCTMSCARKGRAHFHLKECKGPEECEAKANPFVKHSDERYHPFPDKVYDMWLCVNYWNSMNWEPPIEGGQLEEVNSCNYICCHSTHGDSKSFCAKNAWHTDKHEFHCDHKGAFSTNIIDVIFCVDNTGSMSSYISQSKETVKRLMKSLNDGKRSVQFGFVGYRDHPPQDNSQTKLQNLTDESSIQSFISTVSADGGGDGPEAVLDGLHDSIFKITWRKDSMRFIFHIADAPPHGREYTGGQGDGFPEGCPCGINIERLASAMKANHIKYKLMKIGSYANTMASVFKKHIEDYEECDLDKAVELDSKVSEIIIQEIKNEELDILND